jgi:quercetin dioxygenase-like cupin family protein
MLMFIGHERSIPGVSAQSPGALNVVKQVMVGPEQGWEGWVMRLFTLTKEGHSPRHTHAWPHINYVVRGRGVLYLNGQEHELEAGSAAYVPGGAEHQFSNTGDQDFAFICIVPQEGDK